MVVTKKITWKRRGNITGNEFDRLFEKLLPFKKKNETDENNERSIGLEIENN